MENNSTTESAPADAQVDNQETPEVTPDSTDTTVTDGTQTAEGLTDVTPAKGNDTTPGFLKGLEKKNLKLKEKDEELLEVNAELAKTSADHRVKLANSKPDMALKVAQKLGYNGLSDFLGEIEEEPTAPTQPTSNLEEGRSAFIKANNHLMYNSDGSKSDLNLFLGDKQRQLLTDIPDVTETVYLKFMNEAKDHFQEQKKANKTLSEILQSSKKFGTPKSGAVEVPSTQKKPELSKAEQRYLDAMGVKS